MKNVNVRWLKKFALSQKREYEDILKQLVEIPTVSAHSKHRSDIQTAAKLAVALIRRQGGKATLHRTDGNPVLFASFPFSKSVPTVTVYNHLDVQPADAGDEPWRTDPFRFQKQGARYFGRGTTDDKGPALAALFGALAAVKLSIPVNIQFLWEFEEEIGSPHFEQAAAKIADRYRSDVIVISDSVWVTSRQPSSVRAFRGFLGLEFHLQTGETDQHSGDAGGGARNPIGEIMELLCQIHDPESGVVRIPGFYDTVRPVDQQEVTAAKRALSVAQFKRDYQLKSLRVKSSEELVRQICFMPTFDVHGITGGYSGPGIKAIVPPSAGASASFRLVPDQNPNKIERMVRNFVRQKNPDIRMKVCGSVAPYSSEAGGNFEDALANAFRFAFGKDPIYLRGGGTIGAVKIMQQRFRCPIQFLGLSLPEHGYHAANENFDWKQASGGILAFAKYFDEIARMGKNSK